MSLSLLVCSCLRAQPASIEGIAIDAVTREPMAGVHITMRAMAAERFATRRTDTYGAISRSDGHFSIGGMPPEVYVLDAQRNGYIHLPPKASNGRSDATVTLKPGGQLTNFTVEMTPHAVIVGRVVDEFGDPVQHMEASAISAVPGSAEPAASILTGSLTDDRGQFRLVLPPGRFYVQAACIGQASCLEPELSFGPPEIRNDGVGPRVYAATYYPGTATRDQATVVELAAGGQVSGIDIHLSRRRTVTIGGMVTGIPENPAGRAFAMVWLSSAGESRGQVPVQRFAPATPDGKFAIPGLVPGRYLLRARVQFAGTDRLLQSPVVEVRAESVDETGVSLGLDGGEAVSGTLKIEGDRADVRPAEKLTVRLEPYPQHGFVDSGQIKGAEVGEDATFHIDQVFPGRFRVRVLPMPENAFVKSIKLNDADASDGVLDFSRGAAGANIKITLSLSGGQVEGAVLGEDGQSPLGSPAFVALAAAVDDVGDFRPVEAGAKFRFAGLRPGKYRLIAIDPPQFSGDIGSIGELFAKAPEIEIREGDRIAKDVKVMDVEGTSAKP